MRPPYPEANQGSGADHITPSLAVPGDAHRLGVLAVDPRFQDPGSGTGPGHAGSVEALGCFGPSFGGQVEVKPIVDQFGPFPCPGAVDDGFLLVAPFVKAAHAVTFDEGHHAAMPR